MLQHTLIVGTTGAGKSYAERKIISDLLDGKKAQVILVDPKMMELIDFEGNPMCVMHAGNPSETHDAILRAYSEMKMRFDSMKQRKIREWDSLPLYLFVDEMGALMNDHRHRREYGEVIGDITMMGRAARVFCILCTQVPTRENLPNSIRDNMTNKVCMRLDDSSRARFVLGTGNGGCYEDLPRHGKCYVKTPDMLRPERIDTDDVCRVLDV